MTARFLQPVLGYLLVAGLPVILVTAFEPVWVLHLLTENVLHLPALEDISAAGARAGKLQNYPLAIFAYTYSLAIALPFVLYTAGESKGWAVRHVADFGLAGAPSSSAHSSRRLGRSCLVGAALIVLWTAAWAGLGSTSRLSPMLLDGNQILDDKWYSFRPVVMMTVAMFCYATGVHSLHIARLYEQSAATDRIEFR